MADMPDLRLDAPKKDDWFTQIRSLPTWQGILAALPLGLLFIGGLIGGLTGALGTVTNLKIARAELTPTWKVLSMVGVFIGALLTYLLIAAVVTAAF
ncbi:hypothetical protein [Streptomyces sp. NPDC049915]|uniref:hypothetical protein n=1 Tax=Streptomyces sp. NPDC049915 TaxID=3155510 RepID=UPI00341DD141